MENKIKRNQEIVRLYDTVGVTFAGLAEMYKLSRPTVCEIYWREKSKMTGRKPPKYLRKKYAFMREKQTP